MLDISCLPRGRSGKQSAANAGDAGDCIQSLGREDPLEKEMAARSSILAGKIPIDRGARWAAIHGVAKSQTL